MPAPDPLLAAARDLLPDAVALRRRLHRNPELGLQLPETQAAVLEALEGLDLEIATGGSTSAVVATLHGAQPGSTLLLRADMDALPLREETGLEFASARDGAMHACGHDAHTAMLVGAARLLAERRAELRGSVKFLFQPGEEGFGGARVLIQEGLLDATPRVDAAFAIHVNPTLPPGQVALRPGALLAAGDVFSIELEGRGGHASQPHQTLDPIPVACEIVTALQALVTRRMHAFDPVVLSVTKIASGSTHNIIPDSAQIIGTIRTVSAPSRQRVHEKMEKLVQGIASAHEMEGKLHVVRGYPVTLNDAGFTDFVRETASGLLGEGAVVDLEAPIMGSEDFSYILERVPGAMVFLGAQVGDPHPHGLHSSRMVLDEAEMASGIALHGAVALRYLAG